MPQPLAPNAIIQVALVGEQNGQQTICVLHYQYRDTVPVENYRDHMDLMNTTFDAANALYDDFIACISSEWMFKHVLIQPVYPTRLSAVRYDQDDENGLVGGTPLPQNTAYVITKTSDLATRYGRGAMHVPGTSGNWVSLGMVQEAAMPTLEALAEELYQPAVVGAGGDTVPVLWSPSTPARATDITGAFVQDTVRVMRRRTVRVGR